MNIDGRLHYNYGMTIKEYLKQVIIEIKTNFVSSFVNRINQVNSTDFIFYFSKNKDHGLYISINNNEPFVSLIDRKYNFSIQSQFLNKLKNRVMNAFLLNAELLNDDHILVLDFIKTSDTYDKSHYRFIFEIFKANSNLIILENDKVIEAYRTRGLETKHPVVIGLTYIPPKKIEIEKELTSQDRAHMLNTIGKIEENYLKEKYITVIASLKRRKKTLTNKVEKLRSEKEENSKHLIYKDYGDILLANLAEFSKGDEYFEYENIRISLKKDYTPVENSQYYYKHYKKAKTALTLIDKYIESTQNDIDYIDNILNTCHLYNEDDYLEIVDDLKRKNIIKLRLKNVPKILKNPAKPYYFFYNSVKIGFGKNAKQNNELTFNIAKKIDKFIHILNYSGSHVVIFDKDPSDDVISFALEVCLYLANKSDGDIIYTDIANVKKSPILGKVNLLKYETYHLNTLTHNVSEYVKRASRF